MSVGGDILTRLRRDTARVVSHVVQPDGTEDIVTARRLLARGWGFARALRAGGDAPGDAIAAVCLFPGLDLHAAWLGAAWAGYIPSIVAPPSPRMEPAKYASGFRAMAAHVGARVWIVSRAAADLLGATDLQLGCRVIVAEDVADSPADAAEGAATPRDADDIVLVQHSSGTTGLQKAIAVTSRQVCAHTEAYTAALGITDRDVVVSWLPLYHDMGFVACFLTPLLTGMRLVEMSPFDWVRRPLALLDLITRHRGTLCWLPNFAFAFLASARARTPEGPAFDLSSIRAWVNSSEPVLQASCAQFVSAFASAGVRWEQMTASYAMAENVYAVTQSRPGRLRHLRVDRAVFAGEHRLVPTEGPEAMTFVSAGAVLPTTEVQAVDAEGVPCHDGWIGELRLRGACRFAGYLGRPDLTSAAIDADGWYRTGDLGGFVDGELYVTGRAKDLVIIQGRNIYPGDIEAAASEVPGVAPGRVAVFGLPDEAAGTERLIVVAEQEPSSPEPPAVIALRLRAHVAQTCDCTASDVRIVPPRWIVKSTSGKVARLDTRAKYLRDVH